MSHVSFLVAECNGAGEMACPERKLDGTLKCVAKCDGLPECTNGEDEEGCRKCLFVLFVVAIGTVQSTLAISNSDISNSAKLEASI